MTSASDFFRNFQPLFDDKATPKTIVKESKFPWLDSDKKKKDDKDKSVDKSNDDTDTGTDNDDDEKDDVKESTSPAALMRKYSDFIREAEEVDESAMSDKDVQNKEKRETAAKEAKAAKAKK